MNKRKNLLLLFSILVLGAASMNLSGCMRFGGTEKWKEEVQLSDGRVIVVERETIREGGGDEIVANPSGTKPKEYRIRFADPGGSGQQIEWRSTKKDEQTWPEIPLILDIEDGKSVVYTILPINSVCEIYLKYVYQNGSWIEEELPDEFESRKTNLYLRDGIDMPKFVNLETKKKENEDLGYRPSIRQVGPKRKVCGQ